MLPGRASGASRSGAAPLGVLGGRGVCLCWERRGGGARLGAVLGVVGEPLGQAVRLRPHHPPLVVRQLRRRRRRRPSHPRQQPGALPHEASREARGVIGAGPAAGRTLLTEAAQPAPSAPSLTSQRRSTPRRVISGESADPRARPGSVRRCATRRRGTSLEGQGRQRIARCRHSHGGLREGGGR